MEDTATLKTKAICIADHLYRFCVAPDDGKRVRQTGSIAPAGSLKNRKARQAFCWASQVKKFNERYFTLSAVQKGIELLVATWDLKPPLVGLSFELCLTQQSKQILHLCQRARKNASDSLRFLAYRQSSFNMDWVDTVPLEAWGGVISV